MLVTSSSSLLFIQLYFITRKYPSVTHLIIEKEQTKAFVLSHREFKDLSEGSKDPFLMKAGIDKHGEDRA